MEIRAHSNMNGTRKAKARDDLVHLLRQDHDAEIPKVMEKVEMTEMQQVHTKSCW